MNAPAFCIAACAARNRPTLPRKPRSIPSRTFSRAKREIQYDPGRWRGTWGLWQGQSRHAPFNTLHETRVVSSELSDRTCVGAGRTDWTVSTLKEVIIMETFAVYTLDSAPEASKQSLREVRERFNGIPNLAGAMALSPVLIKAFVPLFDRVHSGTFGEREIQTVLLTDAVTNASSWAVALHTALGLKAGVSAADIEAMRSRRLPADKKLAALSNLAKTLIEKRGKLNDQDVQAFLAAGYTKELLLETITIVAASTITNYTGSVTNPPVEDWLQQYAWAG
jgi:alkylhydroperoxidase family enzyme